MLPSSGERKTGGRAPVRQDLEEVLARGSNIEERRAAARGGSPAPTTEGEVWAWREATGLLDESLFRRRLAADGLGSQEFAGLICDTAPLGMVEGRHWTTTLFEALRASALPADAAREISDRMAEDEATFLPALFPFLAVADEGLRWQIARLDATFDPGIRPRLLSDLAGRLAKISGRAVATALAEERVLGRLEGSSPERRWTNFARSLGTASGMSRLVGDYPVLGRLLAVVTDQWIAAVQELLQRLGEDQPRVERMLGTRSGALVDARGSLSDPHRKGRTVWVLAFQSGMQVVYKPRPLAVDARFGSLLSWLNERQPVPEYRHTGILVRGDYGWMEYVAPEACEAADEVRRYYLRLGGLAALLHVLAAVDMHSENLIAVGEHPVLIDLEGLFHNTARLTASSRIGADRSALATGLLPMWVGGDEISAIGGRPGQEVHLASPTWDRAGTDEVRLVRRHLRLEAADHLPTLQGQPVDATLYTSAVLEGFDAVAEVLWRDRTDLLAPNGLIRAFRRDPVRFIPRSTRVYSLILDSSLHPTALVDGVRRDRSFDRLWVGMGDRPEHDRLVRSERHDLWNCDIPVFTSSPGSTDVRDSLGRCIPGYFSEPSLAEVGRRLQTLTKRERSRQRRHVTVSMEALGPTQPSGRPPALRASGRRRTAEVVFGHDGLVEAAAAVGRQLRDEAIHGGDEVDWIGLRLVSHSRFELGRVSPWLYDGGSGIALFLGHLSSLTGDSRLGRLARKALLTALNRAELGGSGSVGAFVGPASVAYVATQLAGIWPELDLEQRALRILLPLMDQVDDSRDFDLLSGAAGYLLALLSAHPVIRDDRLLEAARRCGDRLVATAYPVGSGVAWQQGSRRPPAGLAHGGSGIAMALFRLASVTGDARYTVVATRAIDYERSLFDASEGNWLDVRVSAGKSFVSQWCNGAGGIALARVRLYAMETRPEWKEEARAAIASVMRDGFGANHSLCHGDLGCCEILGEGSTIFGDDLAVEAMSRTEEVVSEWRTSRRWRFGTPNGSPTPGFMTGLAGMGYGILRRAHPDRLPVVLAVDPPAALVPPPPLDQGDAIWPS